MANSAFDHSPTITVPGSSTNTALVRWSSTGADTFLDSTLVLSTSATPTLGIAADPDLLTFGNGTIAITGTITGVTTITATTFSGALSGNATSATSAATLTSARTIGGVSFNGSANINLPGVNTAGNQNTSGSAATLTTTRAIGGVNFDGSAAITLPGVNSAGNQNTSGTAAGLSATLVVASGGTGLTSYTAGDMFYYVSGTTLTKLAKGTADQVLTMNDGASAPGWEDAGGGGATLSGSTNNTVVTVTGSDAMIGEAELLFNGTRLNIGSATTYSNGDFFELAGTHNTDSNIGQATIQSTSSIAADKGGTLLFGGVYQNGGARTTFSGIGGFKDNATHNEYGGYLAFYTRPHGASTTERMRIASTGEVTMPSQPAFLATDRTDTANVTGDGTWYIEIYSGEIFDQNGDYDSVSTFTAPVTGRYHLSSTMACGGVTSSHTSGNLAIMVSNHNNETFFHPWNNWASSEYGASIVGTFLVDMDKDDTAFVRVKVQNGAKTVDFNDNGSSGTHSSFSGFLVA